MRYLPELRAVSTVTVFKLCPAFLPHDSLLASLWALWTPKKKILVRTLLNMLVLAFLMSVSQAHE